MRGQIPSKVIIAFMLMMFIFILGNLIYNIENLYIGEELSPEFYGESTVIGNPVATNSTLADALRFLWFGILGIGILAIVLSAYLFTKSKEEGKWKGLMVKLLAIGVACALIIVVLYTYDEMESEPGTGANPVLADIGGGSGNVSVGQNLTGEAPEGMDVVIMLGIYFAFFAILALGVIGIYFFVSLRREKLKSGKDDTRSKEMVRTIQHAIDTLAKGTDARSTVIRCYRDLCRIMEKHGVKEEVHLTPREFEDLALEKLPISKEHLHNLVRVFEEARYSKHTMSTKESVRARACLEHVKNDLVSKTEEVEVIGR
jgi:hypothetical protein